MNGVVRNGASCPSSLVLVDHVDQSLQQQGKTSVTGESQWELPFSQLPGERLEHTCHAQENYVILTNYRLIVCLPETFYNVSVKNIEFVEIRDLLELLVFCKDGRAFSIIFDIPEFSTRWWQHLTAISAAPSKVEDLFAFTYHHQQKQSLNGLSNGYPTVLTDASGFISELKRLEFDTRSIWRVSEINSKFEACSSYPKFHIVPAWTSDKDLQESARFRSSGRFPSVVWRDVQSGAVLARSSQPEVGLLGWRCTEDEKLLSSIARSALLNSWAHVPVASEAGNTMKPLLIIDARSYTAAFANRAKGGGFEYQEYYTDCQVQFMSLTNIHGIRKSFQNVRSLCQFGQDQTNWLSSLEATKWLQFLSVLLRSTSLIVNAIQKEEQSVLVHCSDGWDRTAQLVSLSELLMDPFYRTIKGFQILIEREWLDFGHKFGDRCGHSTERDVNERSPVFVQWLDCVHQLSRQFPTAFEFNNNLLAKLALHTYSCLYGTFLCNNPKERQELKIKQNTMPVWSLFKSLKREFKNLLYVPEPKVLYPNFQVRHLAVWEQVYLSIPPKFSELVDNEEIQSGVQDSGNFTGDISSVGTAERKDSKAVEKVNNCDNENYTFNGQEKAANGEAGMKVNGIKEGHLNGGLVLKAKCNSNLGSNTRSEGSLEGEKSKCDSSIEGEKTTSDSSIDGEKTKSVRNLKSENSADFSDSNDTKSTENTDCSNRSNGNLDANQNNGSPVRPNESVDSILSTEISSVDNMHSSTTSSTRTITCEQEIDAEVRKLDLNSDEYNQGTKSDENSVSEPTTPVRSKFKGHRRTHSSDGSPIKAVIKTASYTEGINSSAYYAKGTNKKPANCLDNLGLIHRFLSSDGLLKSDDILQSRLQQIDAEHRVEIRKLHKRIELEWQARLAMTSKRDDDQLGTSPGRNSDICDEMLSLPDSTSCEANSLSSISNEESWENVHLEDAQATRWIPDHVANRCGSCDAVFGLVVRKHHCRKCGRVFCNSCSDRYLPVPDEHLYEPVRVCIECFEENSESQVFKNH